MSILADISADDSAGNRIDLFEDWLVELTGKVGTDKLVVLAFPCNQFGGQEPGTDAEISSFIRKKGGSFPVMSKVEVNGPNAHPLFQKLKQIDGGGDIKWNFNKFLISGGTSVRRFGHREPLAQVESSILEAI